METTAEHELDFSELGRVASSEGLGWEITQSREIRLLADSAEAIGAAEGLRAELDRRTASTSKKTNNQPRSRPSPVRRPRRPLKRSNALAGPPALPGQTKKNTAREIARIVIALGLEEAVRESLDDDTLRAAAVPRPGERRNTAWRGDEMNGGSWDPTSTEVDGESSWSAQVAIEKLRELQLAEKRSSSSGRSSDDSQAE